jgi:RNA polymerase sigma-70 factor, ECF subfamily
MAVSNDSFAGVMERLRDGEDEAAREIFARYTRQLVALARRRLDARLAAKVDAEDVVQSAYKSFFVRQRAGQLDVGDWKSLWGLLTVITLRKIADRAAHFRRDKRDASREVTAAPGEKSPACELAMDREPGPEEAALLAEIVEKLMRELDADERPILELSLRGYTTAEIGEELGRAERSVRRLRERIRKRLVRMQEAG